MAFDEAEKAFFLDEIPVGAVIVKDGVVLAKTYNKKEICHCAFCHAEMLAIYEASLKIGNWRLNGCDIYVTLEPCPMCASAIRQARISNIYCAVSASDQNHSFLIQNILSSGDANSSVCIFNNLCVDRGKEILQRFFRAKRKK